MTANSSREVFVEDTRNNSYKRLAAFRHAYLSAMPADQPPIRELIDLRQLGGKNRWRLPALDDAINVNAEIAHEPLYDLGS